MRNQRARELVRENLKYAGSGGSAVYVRINNWDTPWPNDDLEAVVYEGLSGIVLPKCAGPGHVRRLDWKLEELERRRGLPIGSIAVQVLIRASNRRHPRLSPFAVESKRVNSLIFGAVDYTKDMRVKLTLLGGEELLNARSHTACAARAAGLIAIDHPFVAYTDLEAFETNTLNGRQLGYEGRMLIHPNRDRAVPPHIYPCSRGSTMG